MADDLPVQLRAMVPKGRPFTVAERANASLLAQDAADEIERLRAALGQIIEVNQGAWSLRAADEAASQSEKIAKAALDRMEAS